tara:strand:+ start:1474 stop:1962 length:489 start_codon:yes stop_codon:yes gene_type:complete
MGIFKSLIGSLTGGGGIVSAAVDTFKTYFPPDMTQAEKAAFDLKVKELEAQIELKLREAENEAESIFNQRIAEHEGTASDLKAIPFFGPLMLFLRGLQRPVWGFSTLYLDFMWFSSWTNLTDKQESALMAINILVLGFLFGERAIKNVMPLITKLFEAKAKV